jgi:hypothetical protein
VFPTSWKYKQTCVLSFLPTTLYCTELRLVTIRNIVKAAPLGEEKGSHINWIITETMRQVMFDDMLHVFHQDAKDKKFENVDSSEDMDDDHQIFQIGILSGIHGFHGKYAIISLSEVDSGDEAPQYLYWIDTNLLEIPPSLASKAYQARLLNPFFTLHI